MQSALDPLATRLQRVLERRGALALALVGVPAIGKTHPTRLAL